MQGMGKGEGIRIRSQQPFFPRMSMYARNTYTLYVYNPGFMIENLQLWYYLADGPSHRKMKNNLSGTILLYVPFATIPSSPFNKIIHFVPKRFSTSFLFFSYINVVIGNFHSAGLRGIIYVLHTATIADWRWRCIALWCVYTTHIKHPWGFYERDQCPFAESLIQSVEDARRTYIRMSFM